MSHFSHVRTASDVIPLTKTLTLSRRIRIRTRGIAVKSVVGMTGGAVANQLFIADRSKKVVSSFNTQSEQVENDVYQILKDEKVSDLAYNANLKTLFIATWVSQNHDYIVRAFESTNTSDWTQINQTAISSINVTETSVNLRVLPDNTLFFGMWGTDGVQVCPVHQNRTLQVCKRLTLTQKHLGFDVRQINDEILLVAALTNERVGLYRLETEGFVPLNTVDPFRPFAGARPVNPLFIGSTVLVGMATSINNTYYDYFKEALEFRITGGRPQLYNYRHIKLQDAYEIFTWCLMNSTLYVWDDHESTKEIFVYSFNDTTL